MKIFIVDDDETARIVLKDVVKNLAGVTTIEARDGQEALDLLKTGLKPDVCFFDLRMPKVDGAALVGWVRREESIKNLPIVITSGSRNKHEIMLLAEMGISGYLVKPYTKDRVIDVVKAISNTLQWK